MTKQDILTEIKTILYCISEREEQEKILGEISNLTSKIEKDIEDNNIRIKMEKEQRIRENREKIIKHILHNKKAYEQDIGTQTVEEYQYFSDGHRLVKTKSFYQLEENIRIDDNLNAKLERRTEDIKEDYKKYTGEIPSIQELTAFTKEHKDNPYFLGGVIPVRPKYLRDAIEFMDGDYIIKIRVGRNKVMAIPCLWFQDNNDYKDEVFLMPCGLIRSEEQIQQLKKVTE